MKDKQIDTGIIGGGKGIAYVNGKYYLLSETPAKVCVSEDLENWTEYELNSRIYMSNDGIQWNPVTLDTGYNASYTIQCVKFLNNRFVAIGSAYWHSGDLITRVVNWYFESKDGVNWARHDHVFNTNENLTGRWIDYNNGTYVSVCGDGGIFTSSDLINWVRRTSNVKKILTSIVYGKGIFVAVGDSGTVLTSTNGINWTKQNSDTDNYLTTIRYANGMYIACGYNGTLLQSMDGISWNDISSNHSGTRYGMTYNNEDNIMIITAHHFTSSNTIPLHILNLSRELSSDSEEDSSLFFFDKDLNMLGMVDYFISLRWRRKFFEAGEFEIVLPVNDYMKRFANTDVLVMRNNYTEAGIIETIEYHDNGDDEEVTLSGRFLSSLLERRIVKNRINFNGNTIEGMNTIVNAMTPLTTNWETEAVSMDSPHIEFQCTYKNVYNYLCKLSEYSNIGFRVVPNVESKVYMFEVWKGKDRTYEQNENEQYSFSDDNYNIEQGSLVISEKTKANYVLVGGAGEDDNRVLVTVDEGASGFDLYEIFSDQKSMSNDGLSASAYREQLKTVGEGKLSDGTFKLEVTALVQQDYKTKWDLGDIVNIKKEKWNVYTVYRIIEVEEVIEDGKKTIYPSFGSPLSSAWEDED